VSRCHAANVRTMNQKIIDCLNNQMVLDQCGRCGKEFVWIVGCGPWCLCPYCGIMGSRLLPEIHELMEKTKNATS
jgi:DNA-directed RNA polymerase subunit RPC12/RpoP